MVTPVIFGQGRNFIGGELTRHYQQVARERIEASIVGYRDDGKQLAMVMN